MCIVYLCIHVHDQRVRVFLCVRAGFSKSLAGPLAFSVRARGLFEITCRTSCFLATLGNARACQNASRHNYVRVRSTWQPPHLFVTHSQALHSSLSIVVCVFVLYMTHSQTLLNMHGYICIVLT